MALTFTISPSGGTPVVFKDVADAAFAGRGALDWNPGNRMYDTPSFHLPGVDGNLRLRKGLVGGDLSLTVRYWGASATVNAYWASDRDAFANASCSITDGTETYARCELVSASRVAPESGTATGAILFDVLYRFQIDQ